MISEREQPGDPMPEWLDLKALTGYACVSERPLMPRLLRTSDAARYLGLGSKVIRQLIMSGQLPYVQMKPGNSPFLLDRRDLDRFIESRKVPITTKVHRP